VPGRSLLAGSVQTGNLFQFFKFLYAYLSQHCLSNSIFTAVALYWNFVFVF